MEVFGCLFPPRRCFWGEENPNNGSFWMPFSAPALLSGRREFGYWKFLDALMR
jgi:hypothetical protein